MIKRENKEGFKSDPILSSRKAGCVAPKTLRKIESLYFNYKIVAILY